MRAGIRGVSLLPGEWETNTDSLYEEINLFKDLKRFVQVFLVAKSPLLKTPRFYRAAPFLNAWRGKTIF